MARMHRGDSGIGGRWLLISEGSHSEMHPIVLEREGEGGGPWGLNSETINLGGKSRDHTSMACVSDHQVNVSSLQF